MSDNVVVYQDVLHSFKIRKGSKADMLIKLHLGKAYDRPKWSFVQEMLQHFRIP